MFTRSHVLALGALLVVAACDAGPEAAAVLTGRFPAQAARVLESPGRGWSTSDDGGFAVRAGVFVHLPASGDERIAFSGEGGFAATVRELEMEGGASLAGAAVSFARSGGRSYWLPHEGGAEEWLLVRMAAPGRVAAWEVSGASVRMNGDEAELVDAAGEPRMRVAAPEAWAEDGRAVAVRFAVAGNRLELWTEASGLLLVDPAWIATTSLASPRTFHTSTLLPNGLVLVAGGCTTCSAAGGVLQTAELYDPAKGRWSGTGNLAAARSGHTATLLPNGLVLLAGGWNNGGLDSAELYDPAKGTFVATGTMVGPHRFATATLLANGKVLVAGGTNGTAAQATAELYDPATGKWTATGSMQNAKYGAAAVTLPNGKVLVTGGYGGGVTLTACELYDPASGTFSPAASMAGQRYAHTATLLPNGKVLVAGGWVNNTYLSSAEIYDPAQNAWVPTGSMGAVRERHSATLLANGKVLVAGGNDQVAWNPLSGTEIYDPASGSWSSFGTLTGARWNHTATLLPNGSVLLAGGSTGTYGSGIASAETVNPLSGGFSGTGASTLAHTDHTATLLPDGTVLVAGGTNGGSASAGAEIFNPANGTSTSAPAMGAARSDATATLLPDGTVLVAGGSAGGASLSRVELFSPATGRWIATGSLAAARANHTATLLPTGLVLVTGGTGSGGSLASAELYSLATGTWIPAGNMANPRSGHVATLLPSGLVLVTGGAANASAELFDPATGAWTSAGNMTALRRHHTATLLPTGAVLITGGDNGASLASAEIYSGSFTATGSMASARSGHAATLLVSGRVLVTGGGATAAELYDPVSGTFAPAGSLASARSGHTATLLADGRVYVAGGSGSTSAELYDEGRNAPAAAKPTLAAPSGWYPGARVTLAGTLFTGLGGTEASGGTTQGSPTNWPLVMIERQDNEAVTLTTATGWKPTSAQVTVPPTIQPGWLWVRVIVNGVPSVARPVFAPSNGSTLTISPTDVSLAPRAAQGFTASGGSGTYGWSISPNGSGASVSASGGYRAGATCSVTDVVTVTDSYGRTASANVHVGACLTISPSTVNLPPRGRQQFTAAGGNAAGGYTWTLTPNNSGGSVSSSGAYVAGATCQVTDTLTVTDSLGNKATAAINVGACLTVNPPSASLPPRGSQAFTASGGSGSGYTWTVSTNASGASVTNGSYTAGAGCSVTDVVTVTDSLGNSASASVSVGACLAISPTTATIPPRGSQDFTASGGSGSGYVFTLASDDPTATIDPASGHVTAGSGCALTGTVTVRDSLGNTASAHLDVSACLAISPQDPSTPPKGPIGFSATGGSGSGYVFAIETNASGGTIDGSSGAYVAGETGGVTDLVSVTDSLGNKASTHVTITAGLAITPNPVDVPPRGSQQFAVTGGSGTGITWALVRSPSAGTIDATTGGYTAGKNGSVVDTVSATDSLGNTATAIVNVGPEITIIPDESSIEAGAKIAFVAKGGSGTGWAWTITQNSTQGTIDEQTGAYVSGLDGPSGDSTDVVRVTDSLGNVGTAVVKVRTRLRLVADGCDCACSSTSNGMLAIFGIGALWPRRRKFRG